MSEVPGKMRYVELGEADLPAYCPNPSMPIWSSHPRVFLDMASNGEAKCPYCGTVYKVAAGTWIRAH
jgi:uncharacterized Zn-finger protein